MEAGGGGCGGAANKDKDDACGCGSKLLVVVIGGDHSGSGPPFATMSGAEIPLLLIEFGRCWGFNGAFFSSDFFSEKEKELAMLLPVLPARPGG